MTPSKAHAPSRSLVIDGVPVPIDLRRNRRATRLSLRLNPGDGSVVLVLPAGASAAEGLAFARAQVDWIAARLAALPQRIPFVEGAEVPFLGVPHRLHHDDGARRGVRAEDGAIHVSGHAEHFSRRVADWLKRRASFEISERAPPMAAAVGAQIARIRVGDPRSRWGSCNSHGLLAFSWRLVLTPPEVLAYVVAHEVSHLVELNHSPAFWRVVESLAPQAAEARRWLKVNGAALHRYG